jgi:glutamate synthase (NADPH/NADH) small chain
MLGHDVVVLDARPKPGGLNEYGIAAYKVPDDFAQREVAFVLSLGGIELRCGQALGRDFTLAELQRDYDAVFLGVGLGGVNALGLEGENLKGVEDAVAYIERLRQTPDKAELPVGRRVVVIGGGNTAIDVAVQTKRLGAEDVTMVYRRGPEHMTATPHEQEFAQTNGVRIKHWARPVGIGGQGGAVAAVVFEYTRLDAGGRLVAAGGGFTLQADMLFKAIGQVFTNSGVDALSLSKGKIAVDGDRRTSLPKVWAGGDCIDGQDLTVSAVQDGKLAAHSIDRALRGGN